MKPAHIAAIGVACFAAGVGTGFVLARASGQAPIAAVAARRPQAPPKPELFLDSFESGDANGWSAPASER